MSPNLSRIETPAGAAEAQILRELFTDAQNGLRRVIALGLYCHHIKKNLINHGTFQKWLSKHAPDISYRSLAAYMQLSLGILQKCGLTLKGFSKQYERLTNPQMCSTLHICHGGEILIRDEKDLPEWALSIRRKICELIDGKSSRQLFLEFKNAREIRGGKLVPATGAGVRHPRKRTDAEILRHRYDLASSEITNLAVCLDRTEDVILRDGSPESRRELAAACARMQERIEDVTRAPKTSVNPSS